MLFYFRCEQVGTGSAVGLDSLPVNAKGSKSSNNSPLSWTAQELAGHLCHQRWVWSVEDPSVGSVPPKNIAAMLATLVR